MWRIFVAWRVIEEDKKSGRSSAVVALENTETGQSRLVRSVKIIGPSRTVYVPGEMVYLETEGSIEIEE